MGFLLLALKVFVATLAFSANLIQIASLFIYFIYENTFARVIKPAIFIAIADAFVASVSSLSLYGLLVINVNPYTLSLIGSGILFALMFNQYRSQKFIFSSSDVPHTEAQVGKVFAFEIITSPSRYLGYFSLFSTVTLFTTDANHFTAFFLVPMMCIIASLTYWLLGALYVHTHRKQLLEKKLNALQNISFSLIIIFILLGLIQTI